MGVISFQISTHFSDCSVILRQDGGEGQLQQSGDLPVF